MPIYLPQTTASTSASLTPRQIVAELDKYVIGQRAAAISSAFVASAAIAVYSVYALL